jgi:hypothetical protein
LGKFSDLKKKHRIARRVAYTLTSPHQKQMRRVAPQSLPPSSSKNAAAATAATTTTATTTTTLAVETDESLNALTILATSAHLNNDRGTAASLYGELYTRTRAALGDTHPDTVSAAGNLALVLRSLGRHREASPLFHASIGHFRGTLGPGNPSTLALMHGFAGSLLGMGRGEEAAALYRDVLMGRRLALGGSHWDTVDTAIELSGALAGLGGIQGEDLGALGRAREEVLRGGVEGDACLPPAVLAYAKLLYVCVVEERSAAALDAWVQQLKGEARGVSGAGRQGLAGAWEGEGDGWWLGGVVGMGARRRAFGGASW